ncbi:DUF7289 family protein [Natronomonas sp.]|uniref:DUF7289 family protein n=1 Tax=Natronomonas sp. TaxID=2184060 RepID=UPI0026344E3F|nr:hypothetical protein [Natronomonas sp.]
MNDRGVSDIVGYVLIFSLIIATVGVVTTVGFSTLEDRQSAERINNVERAFDVFAANVEDVYREGAPSRATELRLSGGTLRHGDVVRITVADADDPSRNVTAFARPLVYAEGDTEIVYAAGAVFRSGPDSSVMIRDPPFSSGGQTATLPLVETFRTTGPRTVSTDGTVRVTSTARAINTTTSPSFDGADSYTVTVESPRAGAWARYFDSRAWVDDVDETDGAVEATLASDRVTVPRFLIRLRLSG